MEFNFKASDIIKHSAAHVLAAAVKRLYPNVRIGVGPVTKEGFYYDFEVPGKILDKEEFELIEKNIQQIINEKLNFQQIILQKDQGYNTLLQMGQVYKAELLQKIPDTEVSFYKLGDEFVDLCRGPHVKTSGDLGIIKLVDLEHVYWNNDVSRPKMQRIKGIVFQNIVEFNDYNEAIKRKENKNFKKIGREAMLYLNLGNELHLSERGTAIQKGIHDYIVKSLNIQDKINPVLDITCEEDQISTFAQAHFQEKNKSYKQLPDVKIFKRNYINENLHEKELILCVYSDQNNAVIQLNDIAEEIIEIAQYFAKEDIFVEILSVDVESTFVTAISNLFQKRVVSHNKILSSQFGESIVIRYKAIDSVGKEWQICEIKVDADQINYYQNINNSKAKAQAFIIKFPITEILMYSVTEYIFGLPFDIHFEQIRIIPQSNEHIDYANSVADKLRRFKVTVDNTSKSFKNKIRIAEKYSIPFILVVGQKEVNNTAVSVRRNGLEAGLMSIDSFTDYIFEHKDDRID